MRFHLQELLWLYRFRSSQATLNYRRMKYWLEKFQLKIYQVLKAFFFIQIYSLYTLTQICVSYVRCKKEKNAAWKNNKTGHLTMFNCLVWIILYVYKRS